MKKALRHTVVFFLAGIVLLATTGVSVHKLYCYCKGEMVASVFCPDDPCELSTRHQEKGSCCKTEGACSLELSSKHHDCSDCRYEYVKLDAKYFVFSADFQIHAPVAVLKSYSALGEYVPQRISSKIAWENDLPPPAGKELLLWIQSFLC